MKSKTNKKHLINTKLTCIIILAILNFSCAAPTPYQKYTDSGWSTGGFEEQQLSETTYRVIFYGNGLVSKENVYRGALKRSAELALLNGFNYFKIIQQEDSVRDSKENDIKRHSTALTIKFLQDNSSEKAFDARYIAPENKTKSYRKTPIQCHESKPAKGSQNSIGEVFNSHTVRLKCCYNNEIRGIKQPKTGLVMVTLTVNTNGKVVEANNNSTSLGFSDNFHECTNLVLKTIVFPSTSIDKKLFGEEQTLEIRQPFNFFPSKE